MNTIGNFTIAESIIIVLGMLVGAAENISPSEERQKAAKIIAEIRMSGWKMLTPANKPTTTGMKEIRTPKVKEASISPRMIVEMVTGQDMSLSSVLACVSQGATAGDMAVAVKKRIIPRSPGIMKSIAKFLPITKERNRKAGKRMPNITTGPLE